MRYRYRYRYRTSRWRRSDYCQFIDETSKNASVRQDHERKRASTWEGRYGHVKPNDPSRSALSDWKRCNGQHKNKGERRQLEFDKTSWCGSTDRNWSEDERVNRNVLIKPTHNDG